MLNRLKEKLIDNSFGIIMCTSTVSFFVTAGLILKTIEDLSPEEMESAVIGVFIASLTVAVLVSKICIKLFNKFLGTEIT